MGKVRSKTFPGLIFRSHARTTRSVALMDSGRRLLDAAGPGLGQALAALREVAAPPGETVGRVRLSVPKSAVPFVIEPVVAKFRAKHPRIEVEIAVQERLVDVAIRVALL